MVHDTLLRFFSIELLFVFGCLSLNGFFVLCEFALVKVRGSRIQELADNGNTRAQLLLKMLEDMDGHLAATQFGITITSLGLGWIGEPAIAAVLKEYVTGTIFSNPVIVHSVAVGIAFAMITFVQIVFAELIPRALAIRFADRVSLTTAPMLFAIRNFFRPFLYLFDRTAKFFLQFLGIKIGSKANDRLSEDELRLVLMESLGKGALSDTKVDLIDNVFDFSRKTAKHAMIARDNIVYLDFTAPVEDNLARAKQSGHTRYPLCEGAIDNVMGLVNFKDVLWLSEESREHLDFQKIRREILFVPENKPLTKLLKEFQRNKIHMAIVIDEFGVTAGMVSLEDVLEELVGEIQDEYDQEASHIQLLRDGSYVIDGATLIEEVEDKLGIEIEKLDNTTIGGAVLSKIGRLPKVGDAVTFENFTFVVKALKGRRISGVQALKARAKGSN